MAYFRFEARTVEGKLEKGLVEARRVKDAVAELQSQKLTVLTINQAEACPCGAEPTAGPTCPKCGRSQSGSPMLLIAFAAIVLIAAALGFWFISRH